MSSRVTPEDSPDSVVYRLKCNDESAFEDLFDTHFAPLLKKMVHYLRDEQAAKDVVQEVFINVWKNRHMLSPSVPMRYYLERSCINRALNYLRHAERFLPEQSEDDTEISAGTDPHTPFTLLAFEELQLRVCQGIQQLPENVRIAFLLRRFEGMSYDQIAEKLSVSPIVVEKRIIRALRQLRSIVAINYEKS